MLRTENLKKILAFVVSVGLVCVGFTAFTKTNAENKTTYAIDTEYQTNDPNAPVVYMTTEISADSLLRIYQQLGFNAEGNVAVKMSTGEPPSSNYLRPELIEKLVKSVDGTIVECNTAYWGSRSSTAAHMQVARDHGFTAIADVDIMDANGYLEIPVPAPENGRSTITRNYVGANLQNYDSLICLSHFKGHQMAGYGGAIKNMSIGIASSMGKAWIHSGGRSTTSTNGEQNAFLESMADATSSVIDYMDGKIVYINVMNRLSIDCDCNGRPAEPDMHDIGILASYDPVALDQACLDLIEQAEGNTRFLNRVNQLNGYHTLEHAEEIGLGSRSYRLVDIDAEPHGVSMAYANGSLTIHNLEGEAILFHASYSDGRLIDLETFDTVTNGTQSIAAENGDKFFLWENAPSLRPLCSAVTVTSIPDAPSVMNVQIGTAVFTATLEDNAATRELVEMMKEAPVSITMNDYGSFEKVGPLGRSLTTDNHQITTTAGDIVLYQGNQIVMFYGSNSGSYTKIGRINDLTGWREALGSGSITAVFSLAE